VHAEDFEHLRSTSETDDGTLLLNGQRRQENWNNPILTERNAVIGMPGYLKKELTVSTLIKQLVRREPPDWEPTQHERPGAETKRLSGLFPLDPDELHSFCLFEGSLGNDQFGMVPPKKRTNPFERAVL
jgi:hypothetical protein